MKNSEKLLIYALPTITKNHLGININEFDDQTEILIYKSKVCSVKLTIYSDVDTVGFISSLFVDEDYRCKKNGTLLLFVCEAIAKTLNLKILSLYVEKDSFMHRWYNRLGFVDYMTNSSDPNLIELINIRHTDG